jgi:hypothetical protein
MAGDAWKLAGALLVIGCNPTEPTSVEALNAALDRWEARGPSNYDLVVHRGPCECLPQDMVSVIVRVRDGQVATVSNYQTGEEIGIPPFHAMRVEELFGLIDSALAQNAYRVAVRYDVVLGYPRAVAIDYSREAVDDEMLLAAELIH